jgi:hypothetical protein
MKSRGKVCVSTPCVFALHILLPLSFIHTRAHTLGGRSEIDELESSLGGLAPNDEPTWLRLAQVAGELLLLTRKV